LKPTSVPQTKPCINAGDTNHRKRPATYEGPRCYTCWVAEKRRRKKANHDTYVVRTYGVAKGFFDQLFRYQKGRCAWCNRATGRTKKLANDHNHKCCPGPTSCGKCLRGLLCSPCNRHLGYLGDSPEAMLRGYQYLRNPPAQQLIRDLGRVDDRPRTARIAAPVSSLVMSTGDDRK
jgi:Recombination endonuclease VII